jgi:hydrophobe/amphiphile efflux-3 (HAE3) family protein
MVEKVFAWFGRISGKYPWVVIGIVLAITAFFTVGIFSIHQEYGLKTMLPKHSQPVRTMSEAEELFGGTQEEQILVKADDVLDGAVLRKVAGYQAMLEEDPRFWGNFITETQTPLDDMVVMQDGRPLAEVAASLSDSELREQVEMNIAYKEKQAEESGLPLQVQNISADHQAMLLLAKVNPGISESEQNQLVTGFTDETEAYFADTASGGALVGGMVSLNRESSQRTIADTRVLFIIAFIFILVILFLTFRKVSDVLLTMMVIVVTIVWVMGLQGWLGYPFTYTGTAIMPLLLGIDIAYAIHVLSRYYEERRKGEDPHAATFTSVVTVGVAVFLTAATTAFGFVSFGISNMPPIQQFGMLCVVGVMVSFFLAVTLLPAVLILRDRGKRAQEKWGEKHRKMLEANKESWLDKSLAQVSVLCEHHKGIVGLTTLLILGTCIFLATGIGTEADIFKMLPQDMASMEATRQINDYFGGQDVAFTLVKGDVLEPDNLNAILAFEDGLASSGKMSETGGPIFSRDKMTSIADIVYQANNKTIPENKAAVYAVLLELQKKYAGSAGSSQQPVTKDGQTGIVQIRLDRGTQGDMKAINETMQSAAQDATADHPELQMENSGTPILLNEILGNILPTQLKTTTLALILCALIVILIFHSFFFGLAATSVVFLGVAMELGTLALIGWPLDFMTVMVSSLVIGAGIDFGIHVTHRFMEEWREEGLDVDEAIRRTVGSVGKALVAAAVTTAGAFAIIAFSGVSYMRRFGVITAMSLIYALLAALFVLPSILAWRATHADKKKLIPESFGPEIDV